MRWQFWMRTGRQRINSRPRVARAALAAHNVTLEMGLSAADERSRALTNTLLARESPVRTGGLGSATAVASPTALMAAARASHRSVEEMWEETLTAWLGTDATMPASAQPDPARQRRRTVWHDIDATMLALRAL